MKIRGEEAEAAWWVMQLRGITCNLFTAGTWHPDGTVQSILGEPVPSSFYGKPRIRVLSESHEAIVTPSLGRIRTRLGVST